MDAKTNIQDFAKYISIISCELNINSQDIVALFVNVNEI